LKQKQKSLSSFFSHNCFCDSQSGGLHTTSPIGPYNGKQHAASHVPATILRAKQ